jgi:altronate dehydratase
MARKAQVIVINAKDNVATALEPLKAGATIAAEVHGRVEKIQLVSDIPAGHKVALKDLEAGEAVIKYGEPIGKCIARIPRGDHVHVHNVTSQPRGGSQ